MSLNTKCLEDTISDLPEPPSLPLALPISHVSIARWFKSIAKDGHLEPRLCQVFGEELLYLFYGGVFYRPKNKPTQNVEELPIAFLFSPTLLERIIRFYPFDTGGMASGRFGTWSTSLGPLMKDYKVNGNHHHTIPRKMIYHIFNSNESYLHGEPDPNCKSKPYPLPELFDFYSDDLTSFDIDHRQCIIECQTNEQIPLKNELLWIGFPESMTDAFINICKWMEPVIPQFFAYESHRITIPSEMTAKLEEIAKQEVINRYIKIP